MLWLATIILCLGGACQPVAEFASLRETECSALAKSHATTLADTLPGATVRWRCERRLLV